MAFKLAMEISTVKMVLIKEYFFYFHATQNAVVVGKSPYY